MSKRKVGPTEELAQTKRPRAYAWADDNDWKNADDDAFETAQRAMDEEEARAKQKGWLDKRAKTEALLSAMEYKRTW